MKTIRYNSFETNSSSTHAIVVPKVVEESKYDLFDSLERNYYFGREESRLIECWDEKLAYVYLVLKDRNIADLERFKQRVIEIFNSLVYVGREPYLSFIPQDIFLYIDDPEQSSVDIQAKYGTTFNLSSYNYVDHSQDIEDELINRILNDDEFLKKFIFNRSAYITIGGDEFRGYNIKTIGFEYDYEDEWVENELKGEFWNRLEEYKKENDVYLKGN